MDSFTIDYNMRFMLSDNPIHPLVYKVTKIEDVFPLGTYKVTLKQDHYDPSVDDAQEKLCGYNVDLTLKPSEDIDNTIRLQVDGAKPELHIGGSKRNIALITENPVKIKWAYYLDGVPFDESTLLLFNIEESENSVNISAKKDYSLIGSIVRIRAFNGKNLIDEFVELEVKR